MLDNFFSLIEINDENIVDKSLALFTTKFRKIIRNNNINTDDKVCILIKEFNNNKYLIDNLNVKYFDINEYEFFDIIEYNSYIDILIKVFEKKEEYEVCNYLTQKKI